MKAPSLRTGLYLVVDVSLLILCLLHIPKVMDRPMAPFEVAAAGDRVVVTRIIDTVSCGGIQAGDILLSWKGERVAIPEEVEYLADLYSIGSRIPVSFARGAIPQAATLTLIPYYSSVRFLIISLFTGLTMFGLGFVILISRPADAAARGLHWCMITFGTTIMITWGAIDIPSWEAYLSRIIWFIAYLGVAVSFFCFTLLFPRQRVRWLAEHSWIPIPVVIIIGALFSYSNLSALESATSDDFRTFQTLFDIFHVSLFVFVGGGILSIASASFGSTTAEERRKLYWILWGICIGVVPYLFLHILPQVLWSRYIIPEEYTTIFFLAIPVAFAISLLKYKLFDVEVVINRTIVYVTLSVFLVAAYALVVLVITSIVGEEMIFKKYILVAGLTLVVGLLVNPLRLKLQRVVDETLFAARANFRRAVTRITAELHEALNRDGLYGRMVEAVHRVVPSRMLAVYERQDGRLALKSFLGIRPKDGCAFDDNLEKTLKARRALARKSVVRGDFPGVDMSLDDFLSDCNWSLCIPIAAEGGDVLGILVMSPRTAHDHYNEEEINLLHTVCAQASEILGRLILQEEIILAQEEKKRSEELSALKSYFVSSVSHELRMPLTSIRMFAEMLRSGKAASTRRRREYLEIIEGESERLSRLISNILDFAKIERGVKEYEFKEVEIGEIVRRSVNAMRYQFEKHEGKLKVRASKGIPVMTADGDALEEALLNLLSNALKYSTLRREVALHVFKRNHRVVIEVADKGIGIPQSELPNIFDRFYRVRDDRTRQVGGAGLGLALVKHIVDAHRGTLSVKTKVGKGSTFTIALPFRRPKKRSEE